MDVHNLTAYLGLGVVALDVERLLHLAIVEGDPLRHGVLLLFLVLDVDMLIKGSVLGQHSGNLDKTIMGGAENCLAPEKSLDQGGDEAGHGSRGCSLLLASVPSNHQNLLGWGWSIAALLQLTLELLQTFLLLGTELL